MINKDENEAENDKQIAYQEPKELQIGKAIWFHMNTGLMLEMYWFKHWKE